MPRTLRFVLIWLSLGPAVAAEVAWVPTLKEAADIARREGRLIVLDVSADWCPPCQQMAREVHPDPEFQEFAQTQVFMLVDAYKDPEGVRLARQFDVKFFPTILVLSAEGEEIDRLTGGRSTRGLIDTLQLIFDQPVPFRELNRRADESVEDYATQKLAGERALNRKDFRRAREYLGRALALSRRGDPAERPGLLLSHARVALEDDHAEEALGSLEELGSVNPALLDEDSVKLLRARGLVALKRYEEAMEDLNGLLRSSSQREEARKLLTRLPRSFRKEDQQLQQALKRGEALLHKNKAAEALSLAEEAIDLAPDSPAAHLLLARVHGQLQESSGEETAKSQHRSATIRHLLFARTLDPNDLQSWLQTTRLLPVPGVKIEPRQPGVAKKFDKAEEFLAKKNYYEASKLYLKVFQEEPDFGPAFRQLGDCHFFTGDFEQALKAYRVAGQLAPLDASAHRSVAQALSRMGRPEEAHRSLMASLLADPGYPLVWVDLEKTSSRALERHLDIVPIEMILTDGADYQSLLESVSPKTAPAWQTYLDLKLQWQQQGFQQTYPGQDYRYTSREELASLTGLAEKWGEMRLEDPGLEDPELDFLRQLHLDGQLETFVYLELYNELFRSDFEAWKKDQAHQVEPYLEDYVFGHALTALRQGQHSSQVRAYNNGVRVHTSDPAQAVEHYRRALAYEPYNEGALNNLSLLYTQNEDYASAEELVTRWLRKSPDSGRALDRLSWIHFQTGRVESALELIEQALARTRDEEDRQRLERNREAFRQHLLMNR